MVRRPDQGSPKTSPRAQPSPVVVPRQDSSGTLKTTILLGKTPAIVHSGPFYLMKEAPGEFDPSFLPLFLSDMFYRLISTFQANHNHSFISVIWCINFTIFFLNSSQRNYRRYKFNRRIQSTAFLQQILRSKSERFFEFFPTESPRKYRCTSKSWRIISEETNWKSTDYFDRNYALTKAAVGFGVSITRRTGKFSFVCFGSIWNTKFDFFILF